jgi:hypothetical protein
MFSLIAGLGDPATDAMIDCLNKRDLITAIKIGAVATSATESERDWADEIISVMDYIDNELRPRRNRYVHDYWWTEEGGVLTGNSSPKLVKPGPFQRRTVKHYDIKPVDIADLRALLREIQAHEAWLWTLYAWKEIVPRDPEKVPLARRPLRRFPVPPKGPSRALARTAAKAAGAPT